MGREERRWGVKDMIRRGKVNMLTVYETKLQQFDRYVALDMWGRRPIKFIHKLAEGRAGGSVVACNSRQLKCDFCIGEFSV